MAATQNSRGIKLGDSSMPYHVVLHLDPTNARIQVHDFAGNFVAEAVNVHTARLICRLLNLNT